VLADQQLVQRRKLRQAKK